MKILVVGNESGGMFRFRIDLIRELLKRNHLVTILVPDGEFVPEMFKSGCKFIDTPIDRRGINPIKDYKLFHLYKKIISYERPDLVITYTIKPNIYCGLACRIKRVKYDSNITGLGTAFENHGIIRSIVVFLYKLALKGANTVFFENTENKDIFVREGIISENNTCVLNGAGVNTEHFYLADYPTSEIIKFLFIGRIMAEKGFDELIISMRKLISDGHKVELHVVGFCEELFEEKIQKCEQEGWMIFHKRQKDVRIFIEKSHCFVLPSWHEGMANTNLESASMGRPVITTNIHGCLEAVEDGVSGLLCKKKDADDLFQKMKQFISLSYEERKAMGIAGRKRMEEIFDKRKVVQETISRL